MTQRSQSTRTAIRSLADTPPWEWPESAGATLLGILRDRQAPPSDRESAAELAGDLVVMNDEIAGALLSIVAASPKTKKDLLLAAIDAAADIRPEEAGPALADLMDSPDEEIAEAANEAIEMAEMRLSDEDEEDEDAYDDDDEDEDEDDDEGGDEDRDRR